VNLISGRKQFWILALAGLVIISLAGGLAYRPFKPATEVSDVSEAGPPPPPLPGKRVTFLVMGVDQRPDDTGRSDSMMVVAYDQAEQQLSVLSLPRDTWAQIPGHDFDKINHAYAFGGAKLAVSAVKGLLGIPIDHYVTVSFQGFAQLVDALGGVEVDAEKRMEYKDPFDTGMGPDGLVIDIHPGLQHMDGVTALKYARYRMDGEGDFGRMRRQQQVAKAMMKSAAQPGVVTKIPQLLTALGDAIDSDLSLGEMIKLATGAKGALNRPLKTGSLDGVPKTMGGIYYLVSDLVKERQTAYEVLVGTAPAEAFQKRARDDQAIYAAALAEAAAANEPALTEATPAGGSETETPAQSGTEPETQPGTPPGKPAAGGPGGGTAKPPQPTPKPPAKPVPVTIAVIDGSGKNLGPDYVKLLKAAGFRVARIGRLNKPVSQTVAVDHAGQPGTADRIHAVLPKALLISAPNARADEAIEIVLGTDLSPSKP
jgi:LCP family protein required for cell wall assembly